MSEQDKFKWADFTRIITDQNKIRWVNEEDAFRSIAIECARKDEKVEELVKAAKDAANFIDDHISSIPCTSRQRDLDEDNWGFLMFYRDLLLEKVEKFERSK